MSDISVGNGRSAQWGREQFTPTMAHVMGEEEQDIAFEFTRTPVFLSPSMAVGVHGLSHETGGPDPPGNCGTPTS
ncbi:hypothetical protein [Streptomyces sp. NPDC052496]|uniref:hypothetical protein n=1 Tax=Streptomyces sp. NPDC052496 TaxID=3154951 RepID=UPI00341FF230